MEPRASPLRVATIIPLALVMGIVTFTGIVVFLRLSGERELDPEVGQTLLILAAALAVAELPAYVFLRRQFLARARAAKDEALELLRRDMAPPALFTLTVIGAAMAEGLGLIGVIAVLIGAPLYALAVPAVAVVLIVAQIPTRARYEQAVRGE